MDDEMSIDEEGTLKKARWLAHEAKNGAAVEQPSLLFRGMVQADTDEEDEETEKPKFTAGFATLATQSAAIHIDVAGSPQWVRKACAKAGAGAGEPAHGPAVFITH